VTKPQLTVERLLRSGFQEVGCWVLNSERQLTHPIELPTRAGVYAFAVDGVVQYVGLASASVRQRLGFYSRPGIGQRTNIRLHELIRGRIDEGVVVEILIAHPPNLDWNGLKISGSEGLEAGLIVEFELPWNVRGGGKKTKFVPADKERPRTTADRILDVVRRRPGLTELEIAKALYGENAKQQQVNPDCRYLWESGAIERLGVGGPGDPFVYHLGDGVPLVLKSVHLRQLMND
jgi:hypothetical protein